MNATYSWAYFLCACCNFAAILNMLDVFRHKENPTQDEPTTYREAVESPISANWLGAMEAEMQSMYDNQVWTLVVLA